MNHHGFISDRRKLSDAQVWTIRSTPTSIRVLAREMQVSQTCVWSARHWRTYKLPRRR